ncbi:MAG: AAA family ATPase [Chloroflexi bacterium]|nr:AAA family ATPase [Chloroflexota bacterium]
MKISRFHIKNYKSFVESGDISLTSGFNVIVGKNNVGKTALAETLSLQFNSNPHRSLKTIPIRGMSPIPTSQIEIWFEMEQNEFIDLVKTFSPKFFIPLPSSINAKTANEMFLNAIMNKIEIKTVFQDATFISASLPKYGDVVSSSVLGYEIAPSEIQPKVTNVYNVTQELLPFTLAKIIRDRIYFFKAERINLAEDQMGINTSLKANASNLASVLHLLQSKNPARFMRLNELLSTIFPEIKQVTVPPISNERASILVWAIDPNSERDDLAMSLSESGTGIGQVLAMLYVVITSDHPHIIVIDEPQTFLHPGAIHKLIEILGQYPQHQYIITTHSPTVVTSANPQTLLLVKKNDAESVVETINVQETQSLRIYLSEIGARLSDVFGADSVLWVEGRTEELCFPLLLSRIAKHQLLGTTIVGVQQTGDLLGKHARAVYEIYTRLSKGQGLLPPAIGFIFDQEGRSPEEQDDLKRQSKDKVHFLPRRMYENYLLNPEAIVSVMSAISGFSEMTINVDEIKKWLEKNQGNKEYFKGVGGEKNPAYIFRHEDIHGAEVLKDMFNEFSGGRFPYDKIEHGVALTIWLIEHSPNNLEELANFIKNVLPQGTDSKKEI